METAGTRWGDGGHDQQYFAPLLLNLGNIDLLVVDGVQVYAWGRVTPGYTVPFTPEAYLCIG